MDVNQKVGKTYIQAINFIVIGIDDFRIVKRFRRYPQQNKDWNTVDKVFKGLPFQITQTFDWKLLIDIIVCLKSSDTSMAIWIPEDRIVFLSIFNMPCRFIIQQSGHKMIMTVPITMVVRLSTLISNVKNFEFKVHWDKYWKYTVYIEFMYYI